MGKPEIVEVYKILSEDEKTQAVLTFGETEDEWYKLNMYDKNGTYYWLYVKSLEEGIQRADDFVGKTRAI